MGDLIKLTKEETIEKISLRKNIVEAISLKKKIDIDHVARVAVVMDYSFSMSNLYTTGVVQKTLERLLPIAMRFDDNGEMEVWIFETSFRRLPSMTLDNVYGYVDREVMHKGFSMGGTNYAPVIEDIGRKYLSEDRLSGTEGIPTYVIFITDGDNMDRLDTKRALISISRAPIFFQFVGIGNSKFEFLEELDEIEGRFVDNANFFAIANIEKEDDEQLYDKLLTEYPTWLTYPEVQPMISNPPYFSELFENGKVNEKVNDIEKQEKKRGFFARLFGL